MDIRAMLRDIRRYDVMVDRKLDELGNVKSMVEYTGSAMGGFGGGSFNPHRKEDSIIRCIDLTKSLESTICKLTEIKSIVMDRVDSLKDADMVDVMYRRYFRFQKWEDIATDLGMSKRWVLELHGKALKELDGRECT